MSSTTRSQPRVSFASLTPNNLGTVRKLNSVLFPIKYSEKFYNGIVQPEVEDFCKLIYYNDVPVGTFCCRLETEGEVTKLYIMTMGVLASMQHIIQAAAAHAKPSISSIYLHVQVSNDGAKAFYEKHGFKVVRVYENYYKKIVPHDAWVLELEVTPTAPAVASDASQA